MLFLFAVSALLNLLPLYCPHCCRRFRDITALREVRPTPTAPLGSSALPVPRPPPRVHQVSTRRAEQATAPRATQELTRLQRPQTALRAVLVCINLLRARVFAFYALPGNMAKPLDPFCAQHALR